MADITEQAFGSLVEEQKKTTNSLSNVRSLLKQQTDLQYAVTDSQKEGLKIDRAMQQAAQDNYRKNAQDKAKDDSQASKEAEDEDKKGILNKKMLSFLKKMSDGLTDMGKSLAERTGKVGKSIWDVIKKMALGAALLGLIAFLQSPYWEDFRKWVVKVLPPLLMALWENVLAPIARGLGKIADIVTGKKEWTDFLDWDIAAAIAGVAALLFPKTAIGLLVKAGKLVKAAIFGLSRKLTDLGTDIGDKKAKTKLGRGVQNVGRAAKGLTRAPGAMARATVSGVKTAGSAIASAPSKIMGALTKAGPALLKTAAGAAKLIPGIGIPVTAIMGLWDGITAGMEETQKENSTKMDVVREGFAGALSGLIFGTVDQRTISEGMTKAGESIKNMASSFGKWTQDLTDKISDMSSIVGDKIDKLWTGLTSWVGCLFADFNKLLETDFGAIIMEKINKLWTDVTGWIGGITSKLWTNITKGVEDLMESVVKFITDIDFKKIVSKIPGVSFFTSDDSPEEIARKQKQEQIEKQQAVVRGLLEKVERNKADVAEVDKGISIPLIGKVMAESKEDQEEDRIRLEQSQRQLAEARAKLQSMGGSLLDNSTNISAPKTTTTHVNGSIPMTNQNDAVRMAAAGAS